MGGECGCVTERRETTCTDGHDDDCDGLADCEDPDCSGSVLPCEGECGTGVRTCVGTVRGDCLQGDGGEEVCGNGLDDDCDGEEVDAPDSLEPTDECDECYHLGTDVRRFEIAATIDSVHDQGDCYAFTGIDDPPYAERIRVDLAGIPEGVDLDLHLYRGLPACQDREPIASSMNPAGEAESLVLVETLAADDSADYYVRVARVRGASCEASYSLVVSGLR